MAASSQNITFLFTDVEGSTPLWERCPAEMCTAHERHRHLIVESVTRHKGQFVRTRGEGDSTFSVFLSAADAVRAARDAQRSLQAEQWPNGVHLRVRMALHSGAAIPHDGDYNSTDVNRCARLRSIAHGDQILLSEYTRALALAKSDFSELTEQHFLDLGFHKLKDLQEAEHVYQLLDAQIRSEFPPPSSIDLLPNNLPRQLTTFVGRDSEIRQVLQHLQDACLVTLTGPGGAGKTRLALQIGAEALTHFPHGVWNVELAPLMDSAPLARTIATVLGLREDPSRPIEQALYDYLVKHRLLLILDNCEHLIEACAALASSFLRACPDIKILATSREPLGIRGEVTVRVPSLPVPQDNTLNRESSCLPTPVLDAAAMLQYESVRLFVDRACLQQPDFTLTPHNASATAELCRRLDGIPLAIELAAARIRSLTVEQIVARLDRRFQLLTKGDRTGLRHHQTLEALIDWSYDLLTEKERVLLRRISVFAGAFQLEDAEQILPDASEQQELDDWEILDLLASLVDKSLINFEESSLLQTSSPGYYRALETIRQYARVKLADSGEALELQARHRDYYLAQAEQLEGMLVSRNQTYALDRLQALQDEIRLALDFTAAHDEDKSTECYLRFCAALWYFWVFRAYYREGIGHATQAINRTDAPQFPAAYGRALVGTAALAYYLCDHEKCIMLCDKALPICREQNLLRDASICLLVFGTYAFVTRNMEQAESHWCESYALAEAVGDPWARSIAKSWLGDIALAKGDAALAVATSKEGLEFACTAGEAYATFHALFHLGLVKSAVGYHEEALDHLVDALQLCQRSGHSVGISSCLDALATVELARGNQQNSAMLLGGASAFRDNFKIPLPAAFDQFREEITQAVQNVLGTEAFQDAFSRGVALGPEEAIDLALRIAGCSIQFPQPTQQHS